MVTDEQILADMPPDLRQRIKAFMEVGKMTLDEAIREEAMARWQNSLTQQKRET